jgi:hypothetical protein
MKRKRLFIMLILIPIFNSCLEKPVPNEQAKLIETTFKGKYSAVDKNGNVIPFTEIQGMTISLSGELIGSIRLGRTDTTIEVKQPQLSFSQTEFTANIKLSNKYSYYFWMSAFTKNKNDLLIDKDYNNLNNIQIILGQPNEINVRFKQF